MKQAVKQKVIGTIILFCFLSFYSTAQNNQFIDVWAGAGYSSLYHGIDNTKVPGGFGLSVGTAYEYNLNKLMFLGGVEFTYLNSKSKLIGYEENHEFRYNLIMYPNQPETYFVNYSFNTYEEKHNIGYLNIPLQVGMRFNRYYAMIGARIGLNIFGTYKTTSQLNTKGIDDEFFDPMENMPGHYLNNKDFSDNGKLSLGLNISPGAEFGLYLDEWLGTFDRQGRRRGPSYRAGIFVDYGISNMNKANTDNKILTQPIDNPLDVNVNGLLSSSMAQNKRFGSLYAGVKLAVLFQVGNQKKPTPKQKPQPPTPSLFYAHITDAETNENVVDAEVNVRLLSGNRHAFTSMTDSEGMVSHELKNGRYSVNVAAEGYLGFKKTVTHNKLDTLEIAIQRIPSFVARVIDVETKENLLAEVTLSTAADGKQLFKKTTDPSTGIVSHELKSGRYQVNVTSEGYIYYQEVINHTTSETLLVALQPIKKDVVVVLHNLFFALNEAEILPESGPAMDELYQFLTNNPTVQIKIIGHTDNTGSLAYNMRLSQNRAKAVYDTLVERGILPERLSYEGKGPNDPVASNETEEGRAENRRVEFIIQ